MEVADLRRIEQPSDEAQYRVTQIAVQRRHRTLGDPALKAVAHYEVIAAAQLGDERHQPQEVIAVVAVGHRDEGATAGDDARLQCRAVAAHRHRDDARPQVGRDFLTTVGRAVVGDDDLTHDAACRQEAVRLFDTDGQRLGLVEAGHHDRQLDRVRIGVGMAA